MKHSDIPIAPPEVVKRPPYLELHSTSSMGLPRLIPEGGSHVSGKFFLQGMVSSIPSYTIHQDLDIWETT